jgi:hypothetical protein
MNLNFLSEKGDAISDLKQIKLTLMKTNWMGLKEYLHFLIKRNPE